MVTRDDILDVLRTINDPEMPISIVDLGIVERITIAPPAAPQSSVAPAPPAPAPAQAPSALAHPAPADVEIVLLPTFVGCPALAMIEQEVRGKVAALPGIARTTVHFTFDPPWSVERISEPGRRALESFGVTVAAPRTAPDQPAEVCPFCRSTATHRESLFGPTRCRMIYYCEACRNSFEPLRRI